MKINLLDLNSLPQQRLLINFNQPIAGLEAVKPVVGDLLISADASGARMTGRIQTLLKLTCHTCLNPFFQPLKIELDERFIYEDYLNEEKREARDKELQTDDFNELISSDGVIDISETVYQSVVLATPIYCSCGSQCPGPPLGNTHGSGLKDPDSPAKSAGQDAATIDPRWKNLKTLFPSEESH